MDSTTLQGKMLRNIYSNRKKRFTDESFSCKLAAVMGLNKERYEKNLKLINCCADLIEINLLNKYYRRTMFYICMIENLINMLEKQVHEDLSAVDKMLREQSEG